MRKFGTQTDQENYSKALNVTIGTRNTRTLRAAGKLKELTHEMNRYGWNILRLCEIRWKNFGETTKEGHKVFSCGKEDKHK